MNKFKLFIENFLIYGLGGIISKIVPLVMVPIVTRLMPTSDYYGLSDMSNTIMSIASAIAVMGMYDAMYRMFFDKDEEDFKRAVCSTTALFTFATSAVVFVVMLLCRRWIAAFFFDNAKYAYLVYFTAMATLVGATNSIISAPTRMQNKRGVFLAANTLGPILSYSISIPLLLKGYYVIALPLAGCISNLTLEIAFGVMNRKWFSPKLFDKKLLKTLLRIGIPLLPNFLIYWVFNSSDRVMITRLIGIGQSGIYSVGAKLGMASQLIYTAFAGGWQYFAFVTMKEADQVRNNSRIFEYLGCVSFAATLFICSWAEPIYRLLFEEEYHRAFIVSPYLFLAPLLQMLFQVADNQFLVIKKTWPNLVLLALGALANVVLNLVLIPRLGIEGASIATLIGYVISNVICSLVLIRMELMVLTPKFFAATAIFGLGFVFWRRMLIGHAWLSTLLAVLITCVIAWLYRGDLQGLWKIIRGGRKTSDSV